MTPAIHVSPHLLPAWSALVCGWAGCKQCPCHLTRSRIVHYRGFMPCDVLFIGEAPGDSEDTSGFPFVGPAGDLFEELLAKLEEHHLNVLTRPPTSKYEGEECLCFSAGITNIVACRPKTPKTEFTSGELRIPTAEEAAACEPRLREIIQLVRPKLIVTLGKVAQKYLPDAYRDNMNRAVLVKFPTVVNLLHPSAILRADDRNKPRMTKRWVLDLASALENPDAQS